jgi:hypothetical protein
VAPHRGLLRRLWRAPELPLCLLVLGAYAYFYQAGGWNQNSRFDLVRAAVERGTASIDAYHENTGDKAMRGAHHYSDKAPGTSWLAIPAYALVRAGVGGGEPDAHELALATYVVTLWAVGIPSAVGAAMLCALLRALGLGAAARAAFAVAYALATLAFPYSTLFYGHQLAASLLLLGFGPLVLSRRPGTARSSAGPVTLLASGGALGFAIAVEYPAALAVAPISAYAAWLLRPRSRVLWLLAGMLPPIAALALYHGLVFGSPFALPYAFSTQSHRHAGVFMGLGAPQPGALYGITFSAYRGLFYSAPWLLLALPGAAVFIAGRRHRPEALVCCCSGALFVWLNASLVDWQGAWAVGPRYLVPCLPFFAIAAAGTVATLPRHLSVRSRRLAGMLFAVLVAPSALLMLASTAVKPEVPSAFERPFTDLVLPAFRDGDLALNDQSFDTFLPGEHDPRYAWNLGQLAGLSGLASLVPLLVYALVVGTWLWLRTSSTARPPATGGPGRGT